MAQNSYFTAQTGGTQPDLEVFLATLVSGIQQVDF